MNAIAQRLSAVRQLMADAGYDALVVPRADEYLGEYIPAHNERLQWVSGFNGSAGVVIVLRDRAAIFVDGRYTVQVRQEVSADLFEYHHLIDEPHVNWLAKHLSAGAKVAFDPRMHPLSWYRRALPTLETAGIELLAETDNLIDRSWNDRPDPVVKPAIILGHEFTGETSAQKRSRIGELIAAQGADAALVFAPDSVSWLLNFRGTDIPSLPIVQSSAVISSDGSTVVFIDPARVPAGLLEHVGTGVELQPETEAQAVFKRYRGKTVIADPSGANAWSQLALEASGVLLKAGEDPVLMPKACKNAVEVEGARRAHIRDAVAECRFLAWLDNEVDSGNYHDEAELSDKLLSFRAMGEHFHETSFDTISAVGANAAMCHYNHLNGVPAKMEADSAYLVDSGGQYTDGTTDITRTVAIGDPGDDVRRMYTLVLKGHIALAQARFPAGTNGTQLDALARQFLWREGYDYDHGTGHGVGAFLSVHEAPQRIAKHNNTVELQPGMIISNEPGYYRDGAFGIRCENLVVVRPAEDSAGETPVMEFETITLVPFDNRLLLPGLLTDAEKQWLNAYHEQVRTTLEPLLEGADLDWLLLTTQAVAA